jgi:hypothetical protein
MSSNPKPTPPPSDDPQTLNVACPHCFALSGKPLGISTRKGDGSLIDVNMRCTSCNQTWIVLAAVVNTTVVADENLTVGSTVWLPAESIAPGR